MDKKMTMYRLKKWLDSEIYQARNAVSDLTFAPLKTEEDRIWYAKRCEHLDTLEAVYRACFPVHYVNADSIIEDPNNAELLYYYVVENCLQEYENAREMESDGLSMCEFVSQYRRKQFVEFYEKYVATRDKG